MERKIFYPQPPLYERVNLMRDYRNYPGEASTTTLEYDISGYPVDFRPIEARAAKALKKNGMRNMPCPICGSGRKFKKCCWGRVK